MWLKGWCCHTASLTSCWWCSGLLLEHQKWLRLLHNTGKRLKKILCTWTIWVWRSLPLIRIFSANISRKQEYADISPTQRLLPTSEVWSCLSWSQTQTTTQEFKSFSCPAPVPHYFTESYPRSWMWSFLPCTPQTGFHNMGNGLRGFCFSTKFWTRSISNSQNLSSCLRRDMHKA